MSYKKGEGSRSKEEDEEHNFADDLMETIMTGANIQTTICAFLFACALVKF